MTMFKVGQEVWDMAYGWGVVHHITFNGDFRVNVVFKDADAMISYDQNGKYFHQGRYRTLFFKEIPIPKSALEYKEWRANHEEYYYYVDEVGEIKRCLEIGQSYDETRFKIGNYFKTEVLARNSRYFKVFSQCE